MRLVVEVRLGSRKGRKAILTPGSTLRVGRTDSADLVIPKDPHLSGVHFELAWDGAACMVRDLQSAKGTILNGETVQNGEVAHGDWIQAGDNAFSIYREEATPPRRKKRRDPPGAAARRDEALKALRAEAEPLYAVLDAARDERILEVLRESVEEYASLYDGIQGEALAEEAPYLVGLPKEERLIERLVKEGWGRRWGIFLTCERPFKEVRRHLRRFLMVEEDETGEQMYFRYYDPAVLRLFLPICTPMQKEELFGDFKAFLVEAKSGEVLRFAA
jgi:pSer/pThr/pTyr-binding forkhead associated (FHA) protein